MRSPLRDRYFIYTSLLGTHSFFLIFLPMPYWMGGQFFARGLVLVLALGVYASSAIKDWLCVPRPYSPPVTRLTIGTHHLEYGFPSTHSTNAVSIAAYAYLWVLALRERALGTSSEGFWGSRAWEVVLLYYCCSVVYGRLYAGMHSMVDCLSGSLLGLGITWLIWASAESLERFLTRSDWLPPAIIVPLGLLMVSVHPQPLDDCPCFEDAIAFVAVAMGTSLGRWAGVKTGLMSPHDNPLGTNPVGRFLTESQLFPARLGALGAVSRVGSTHSLITITRRSASNGKARSCSDGCSDRSAA